MSCSQEGVHELEVSHDLRLDSRIMKILNHAILDVYPHWAVLSWSSGDRAILDLLGRRGRRNREDDTCRGLATLSGKCYVAYGDLIGILRALAVNTGCCSAGFEKRLSCFAHEFSVGNAETP